MRRRRSDVLDFLRHTPKIFNPADADQLRLRAVPDNLWVKCPHCKELIYTKEYEKSLKVCQKCGFHARLTPGERLRYLLDEESFQEVAAGIQPSDPLDFTSEGQLYRTKL